MKVYVLSMGNYLYYLIYFKLSYNNTKSNYYINPRESPNNRYGTEKIIINYRKD